MPVFAWLVAKIGSKWATRVVIGLVGLAALAAVFTIGRCSRHDDNTAQVNQTTASSDAIANAATTAIDTIQNRSVTEKDIDHATAVAQLEIDQAADPAAVRGAVVAGVCANPAHRNDPACAVR